jgi:hypothetical protein
MAREFLSAYLIETVRPVNIVYIFYINVATGQCLTPLGYIDGSAHTFAITHSTRFENSIRPEEDLHGADAG